MLIKHCGFSRVPHDCFTLKTSNILCITFFEIILIVVKGTSLFVFQIRMDTITFPFYYECNFFLLNIHLFSDYFSSIFFSHILRKGILSLSFINYLHFTILYIKPRKANLTVDSPVIQLIAVYIKMK